MWWNFCPGEVQPRRYMPLSSKEVRSLPVAYRNLSPVFEGMTGAMAQIKFAKCSSVRVISS